MYAEATQTATPLALARTHPLTPPFGTDAFAVAAVAVIVGSIVYALIKARPDRYDFKVATLTNIGDVSLGTCLASFMMVWWAFAVGILTFWSPYTSIGNGYLAVWLGVVSSAYTLGINRRTNQIYALGPAFGLLASSFVVMLALLPRAYAGTWTRALGLTVSVFSIVAMLAVVLVDQNLLKLPTAPMTRSVLCVVLAISWTVTSLILTYRGPFTSSLSANGYLGSWTGLAFALIYASENVGPLNDKIKYKAKDEEAVSA